jgi:hypothetical protein
MPRLFSFLSVSILPSLPALDFQHGFGITAHKKGIHFSRVDLILMIDICLSPVSGVLCVFLCLVLFRLVHDRPLLFLL